MHLALITGGSSGIGFAMAKELARKKKNLLLVSNQEKELQQCKQTLEKNFNVQCFTLYKDLTEQNAAQDIFDYCKQHKFEIDILINNAGMLVFSEVVSTGIKRVNAILQLHIYTPTMLCRLFGEEMKHKRRGLILNVSSVSAVMPYPGISLYGPTKTYMRYFTRAFRSEMKIYNVTVTCLIPGATITALYDPNKINLQLAKKLGIMKEAESVAKSAVSALYKNKAKIIPGTLNKLTIWFMPLIPSWVIYQIHKRTSLIKKGHEALD
ncbi:SDR family NAD(P)-dependent oxidoreductase [Fluviicola sp.]|jgi:short-subunit dehydrogenase|uniref:SDR family NAD(P)-dependent oxidoreductase n=1 Tax=Fluviicola sp. TaxID=1917219 RepID=UPI00281BFDD2|nr:SDR family NAD(P)-dependent oxidoreductase [Fluviicola sp.]MDR0803056.1 SDR family NAD(P)-dependent oxidoreductase [Fluviicola sp.]